jgi:hypothetical protein
MTCGGAARCGGYGPGGRPIAEERHGARPPAVRMATRLGEPGAPPPRSEGREGAACACGFGVRESRQRHGSRRAHCRGMGCKETGPGVPAQWHGKAAPHNRNQSWSCIRDALQQPRVLTAPRAKAILPRPKAVSEIHRGAPRR